MPKRIRLCLVACLLLHASAFACLDGDPTHAFSGVSGNPAEDRGHALAVGPDGAAYQVGAQYSPNAAFVLAKYSSQGQPVWRTGFPDCLSSYGYDLVAVEDGLIAVGNASMREGDADGLIVKYDFQGQQAWHTFLEGEGDATIHGITVDQDGNLVIAGRTWGELRALADETGDHHSDGFIAKLSPTGELIWIARIGALGLDLCQGATVSASGSIYVYGETATDLLDTGQPPGAFVAKFNTHGVMLWAKQWDIAEDTPVLGASASSDGGVIAALGPALIKLDPDGEEVWRMRMRSNHGPRDMPMQMVDVLADGEGGAFFTMSLVGALAGPAAGDRDMVLGYINSEGHIPWARQMGSAGRDLPDGLATNGSDRIYFGGEFALVDQNSCDAFVSIYQVEGITWQQSQTPARPESDP